MEPIAGGAGSPAPPPERRSPPEPDIEIVPFKTALPLSRGAPERKLRRTDLYRRRAEVTRREVLTPTRTVALHFRVIDDEPFDPLPGHFVGIQAEVRGYGVCKSPYCLSSPPSDARTFRLIVRAVSEGPLSLHLESLAVGDVIQFRGPSGRSMIPKEDDTELVMMATGVGVGPLLAFLGHVLPAGLDRRVQLFWGLRQVEDICLVDELDRLVRHHDNFTYRVTLSEPPEGWEGLRGRLTDSVPPLLPTLGAKHYYLVGNGAMTEEMSAALSDLGVDKQLVYQEPYFNERFRPDPRTIADIRERFVASDLFSPYRHQQAGRFLPENPVSRRRSTG